MMKKISLIILIFANAAVFGSRYDGSSPGGSSLNGLSSQGTYGGQPSSWYSNDGNQTDYKYGYGTSTYKKSYAVPSAAGSFGGFPSPSSPLTTRSTDLQPPQIPL